MSHVNRPRLLVIAHALLLCACGASHEGRQAEAQLPARQGPPAKEIATVAVPAPSTAAAPAGNGASGLQEFIDPATGQHREPTAAEIKALESAKSQGTSAAPDKPRPREITLPNGMVAAEAAPPAEMKGCLQKDGSVVVDHDCAATAPAPAGKP